MKYLKQFCIILLISFVGEIANHFIPLPIPASIYGIIILFLGLESRLIPLEDVKDTGKLLIEIMPVMFIPAAAGIIDVWSIISSSIAEYVIIMMVSTIAVMAVSGLVTQLVIRIIQRSETAAAQRAKDRPAAHDTTRDR